MFLLWPLPVMAAVSCHGFLLQDIEPSMAGLVVIDDASDDGACGPFVEFCTRHLLPPHWRDRTTLLRLACR